ncbi:MAG: TetR/AcrR family transcriptional regulator [Crocinitomicaceae bacterium]
MKNLLAKVALTINDILYMKDPNSSSLGIRIIKEGISLLDEVGFEQFTFKKLALRIETTEASVYRYFESKHQFLLYLINWYWGMIEYRLAFETANISDAKVKLKKAIHLLTSIPDPEVEMVFDAEVKLKRVVINEASKVYFTKEVDKENEHGAYAVYKSIVSKVVEILEEINPNYPYGAMLVTTIIESSNQQRFFGEHLPRLTNTSPQKDNFEQFALDLVFKTLAIHE